MKKLEDMTLGQRIVVTFIIVIIILFALALCGWMTGGWEVEARSDLYGDVPLDAQLLPTDRKALDEAYRAHLIKLWNVWLSDGAKDATYFRKGLIIARGAYAQADQALTKREKELAK
jgi:hypothetical protein